MPSSVSESKRTTKPNFGQGLNFFHLENWYSILATIRNVLLLAGLYGRGCRNAARVQLRVNEVASARLPPQFHGFRIDERSSCGYELAPRWIA